MLKLKKLHTQVIWIISLEFIMYVFLLHHHRAPDIFFFQSVSYWSNLKPVSVGPKWDSRISIHFADNLIVILSLYIYIYYVRYQQTELTGICLPLNLTTCNQFYMPPSFPQRALECRNNHFAKHMTDVPLRRYDQNWKRCLFRCYYAQIWQTSFYNIEKCYFQFLFWLVNKILCCAYTKNCTKYRQVQHLIGFGKMLSIIHKLPLLKSLSILWSRLGFIQKQIPYHIHTGYLKSWTVSTKKHPYSVLAVLTIDRYLELPDL